MYELASDVYGMWTTWPWEMSICSILWTSCFTRTCLHTDFVTGILCLVFGVIWSILTLTVSERKSLSFWQQNLMTLMMFKKQSPMTNDHWWGEVWGAVEVELYLMGYWMNTSSTSPQNLENCSGYHSSKIFLNCLSSLNKYKTVYLLMFITVLFCQEFTCRLCTKFIHKLFLGIAK